MLSPSTERHDRGRTWLAYQALPELRHFVLVAQDQRRVEAYRRESAGWRHELLPAPDAVLRLDAVGVGVDETYGVVPVLAAASDARAIRATFGPAEVVRIAGLKGLPASREVETLVARMEAEECAAAVAALVGSSGPPAKEQGRAVLPERLRDGLETVRGGMP